MEIAVIALQAVSTAVGYISANNNAKAYEQQAERTRQEGEIKATEEFNKKLAETEEINAEIAVNNLNKKIQASIDAKKRDELEDKLRRENARNYLTIDKGQSYHNLLTNQIQLQADALTSFDFDSSQNSYQFFKTGEEYTRKRDVSFKNAAIQKEYVLGAYESKAINLENQAIATKNAANVNLLTNVASIGTSYVGLGSSEKMLAYRKDNPNTFKSKFFSLAPSA